MIVPKKLFRIGIIALCFSLSIGETRAGQVVSHALLGERLLRQMPPPLQRVCERYRLDYMTGAQGPDIAGVGAEIQDLSTVGRKTFGRESHYQKTGQIGLMLMHQADSDRRFAFAVGWITHYVNDVHVHALVNQYGGLYDEANEQRKLRHKALEVLECYHIFANNGLWHDVARNWNTQAAPGEVDTIPGWCDRDLQSLVCSVFSDLFGGAYLNDNARLDFGFSLKSTADTVRSAARMFRRTYVNGGGEYKPTSPLDATTKLAARQLPRMPTRAEYDRIAKGPLEWIHTQANAQDLQIRIRVNDSKLFGRFLKEWTLEINRATDESAGLMTLINQYYLLRCQGGESITAPSPNGTEERKVMQAMRRLLPDVNLDNPPLQPYREDEFWPGDVDLKQVRYEVDMTWIVDGGEGEAERLQGDAVLRLSDVAKGYQDSRCGVATVSIPIHNQAKRSYRFTTRIFPLDPREAKRRGRPVLEGYDVLAVSGVFGATEEPAMELKSVVEKWPNGNPRFVYTYYDDLGKPAAGGNPFAFTPRMPVKHGIFTSYNHDGSVSHKGQMVHGEREGAWVENDKHGRGNYSKGKREGHWTKLSDAGALVSETNFLNGLLEGRSCRYSVGPGIPPGTLAQEWTYSAGKMHGPYGEYDLQRRPRIKGQFSQGKPSGSWQYWRYTDSDDKEGKVETKPAPPTW